MGYVRDQPDREEAIAEQLAEQADLSAIECPRCGANCCTVLAYPRGAAPRIVGGAWEGAWYGGTSGKAHCDFCNIVFSIQREPEE